MKIRKQISDTAKELLIGITIFGLVAEVIGVFFVKDKVSFTIGLLLGLLLAMLSAIHMWWALDKAMELNSGAQKVVLTHNMVRYGVILLVFAIICYTDYANPLAAFLGIMGLKVGAYLQPFTHKCLYKSKKKNNEQKS